MAFEAILKDFLGLADHPDFFTCLTFNLLPSFLISRWPKPRLAPWVGGMASAFGILYSQPEISSDGVFSLRMVDVQPAR